MTAEKQSDRGIENNYQHIKPRGIGLVELLHRDMSNFLFCLYKFANRFRCDKIDDIL